MRYLIIFIWLNSCVAQDCAINPTMERDPSVNSKTKDVTENKAIIPNIQELREQVRPGGQLSCKF
jgi:predicted 2-oxoglutarate/Fe(II)-dependent dioxygenase YbiX